MVRIGCDLVPPSTHAIYRLSLPVAIAVRMPHSAGMMASTESLPELATHATPTSNRLSFRLPLSPNGNATTRQLLPEEEPGNGQQKARRPSCRPHFLQRGVRRVVPGLNLPLACRKSTIRAAGRGGASCGTYCSLSASSAGPWLALGRASVQVGPLAVGSAYFRDTHGSPAFGLADRFFPNRDHLSQAPSRALRGGTAVLLPL